MRGGGDEEREERERTDRMAGEAAPEREWRPWTSKARASIPSLLGSWVLCRREMEEEKEKGDVSVTIKGKRRGRDRRRQGRAGRANE